MAMTSYSLIHCLNTIVISVMAFTLLLCLSPVLGAVCCSHHSKLAYFSNDEAVKVGACGFGASAAKLLSGNVAAASPSLYKSGRGCSVCYHIRCKDNKLCNKYGAKIVVTDMTSNNQTDFVVPKSTFASLARTNMDSELIKAGIVDIEYKRIFCEYVGHNLTVKVHENSQYPHYLALEFLYQEGQTEIVTVDVATVDSYNWRWLRPNYGAVWDISNPPKGDLRFRLEVTSGFDGYFIYTKGVLPSVWKKGGLYDCGLQINQTDIGGNGCYTCGASAQIA